MDSKGTAFSGTNNERIIQVATQPMKSVEPERSQAQVEAEKRYAEKRKTQPRLPGGYLSDEEDALLTRVAQRYGSKKEAIFEGLKLLDKQIKW